MLWGGNILRKSSVVDAPEKLLSSKAISDQIKSVDRLVMMLSRIGLSLFISTPQPDERQWERP